MRTPIVDASQVVITDQKTPNYGADLSSSTFCGVLPGWGWSGRMEDAVLHGCIPVIMQVFVGMGACMCILASQMLRACLADVTLLTAAHSRQ